MGEREKERHFVLRLLEFTFETAGATVPDYVQTLLADFLPESRGYFTDDVSKSLIVLFEHFHPEEFPGEANSYNLNTQLNAMESNFKVQTFLSFLAHFCVKVYGQYRSEENIEILTHFYDSVLNFLTSIRELDEIKDFWGVLHETAFDVINDSKLRCKYTNEGKLDFRIDMTEGNEFILEVMTYIFELDKKDLPVYMIVSRDRFRQKSRNLLTNEIKACLSVTMVHQTKLLDRIYETSMRNYCSNLVTKSYNEADFLDMCVCYCRKAKKEYWGAVDFMTPLKVFDLLSSILEKETFSLEKMVAAARQLLDDDRERTREEKEHMRFAQKTKEGTKRPLEASSSDSDQQKSDTDSETSENG